MHLPRNHPLFKYQNQVRDTCRPLFDINIQKFSYVRIYKNGRFFHFDTHPEFANDYYESELYPCLVELENNERPFVILSSAISHPHLSYSEEKLAVNIELGINHGIFHRVFVVKKKDEFYEIFGFGTTAKDTNMIDYLLMSLNIFNRFSLYFRNEFRKEISASLYTDIRLNGFEKIESEKSNINASIDLASFTSEKILKNYNLYDKKLSFREIQCLHFLAHGLTTKGISKSINLTPKTVESYLYNLKCKLGCHTKNELIDLFYASDLSDIEDLF